MEKKLVERLFKEYKKNLEENLGQEELKTTLRTELIKSYYTNLNDVYKYLNSHSGLFAVVPVAIGGILLSSLYVNYNTGAISSPLGYYGFPSVSFFSSTMCVINHFSKSSRFKNKLAKKIRGLYDSLKIDEDPKTDIEKIHKFLDRERASNSNNPFDFMFRMSLASVVDATLYSLETQMGEYKGLQELSWDNKGKQGINISYK